MPHRTPRIARWLERALVLPVLMGAFFAGAYASTGGRPGGAPASALPLLPPAIAVGIRVDTLVLGGYASGTFAEAVRVLASDLAAEERELVGQHLHRIFAPVSAREGLGRAGRLRVAYERTSRPDGSTRAVRVLTAEAAVAGQLHTAFYYEHDGEPGYYDRLGHPLEARALAGPLPTARVTSAFGARRMHPVLRRVLPHTGVDYAAPAGMPVRATADGVVETAARTGGYGNLVELRHPNGYSTRYAHLSAFAPGLGRARWVRQGEVIGYVGRTGLATGPHLHYELRRAGRPVDPVRAAGTPAAGPTLATDPEWSTQRRRLARLLARTPDQHPPGTGRS